MTRDRLFSYKRMSTKTLTKNYSVNHHEPTKILLYCEDQSIFPK
jgi:hypothetical protein